MPSTIRFTTTAARQWKMMKFIGKREGTTVRELCQRFNSHENTVRRDINTLVEVGFAMDSFDGTGGRRYFISDPKFKALLRSFNGRR
jgi:predicted DNA-binding transcriptional regulator YafY